MKTKCANCGKTIAPAAGGSLTAWLFRQAECRCESESKPKDAPDKEVEFTGLTHESGNSGYAHKSGELIGESYEVIEPLGRGGMGEVYRVRDRRTETVYALKIIAPGLGEQEILRKRLEHEAQSAKSLTHENIAAVYDVGRDSGGAPFLIMDYVAGQNLEQLLHQEVFLQSQRAIDIFMQIAEALVHAHNKGVVHRDLKPSNILLAKSDVGHELVKLVDFGIAKLTDAHSADKTKLTQAGDLIGSPLYMSPEQCRGDNLDGRSDIYSFGCIMYEAVSGKTPFAGDNPVRILLKHASEPAPRLLSEVRISQSFKAVIERCLEKLPENRYPNAAALLQDLKTISDGKPLPWARRLRLAPHRKRTLILCSGAMMLFAALGFAAYFFAKDLQPNAGQSSASSIGSTQLQSASNKKAKKEFKHVMAEWDNSLLKERAAVMLATEIEKRAWTVAQAANYLGADPKSLADLIHCKAGTSFSLNHGTSFTLEQLNQFLLMLGIHPTFPKSLSAEENQNAVAYYKRAIKYDPKNSDAYWLRSRAYQNLHQWDLAIADTNVVIALRPNDVHPLNERAMAYLEAGKYEQALADCDELLRRSPDNQLWYQNRGLVYEAMKKYDKALSDFNEAIKHLDIPRPGPYFNRAKVYKCLGRYKEAIADLKKVKEIDPPEEPFMDKYIEKFKKEEADELKKAQLWHRAYTITGFAYEIGNVS